MSKRMLVVSAHAGDFVWRAGGAIAKNVARGGSATVVALSYGERGESGELWKVPDQTVANVKAIREQEARAAAGILGATLVPFDLGDYPLEVDRAGVERLTELMRDLSPEVVITHTRLDPGNPDHPEAHRVTLRARQLAAGAGVPSAFKTIPLPALYAFEPHQVELCEFNPDTYLDITDAFERKQEAMAHMGAQTYMVEHYTQRGEHRGAHARRFSSDSTVKYAEAFERLVPRVVGEL